MPSEDFAQKQFAIARMNGKPKPMRHADHILIGRPNGVLLRDLLLLIRL